MISLNSSKKNINFINKCIYYFIMTNIDKLYKNFTLELDDHIDGLRHDTPECRSLTNTYFSDVWRYADRLTRKFVQDSMPCRATAQLWLPAQSEDSLESMADYFNISDDMDRLEFIQATKAFDEKQKTRDLMTYGILDQYTGHSFRLQPWGDFNRDHIGNLVCVANGDIGAEGKELLQDIGSHLDTALRNTDELVHMAQENRDLRRELMKLKADYEAVKGGHVIE